MGLRRGLAAIFRDRLRFALFAAGVCSGIFSIFIFSQAAQVLAQSTANVAATQAALQQQLNQLEAQDTSLQTQITSLEGQKATITQAITLLDDQIQQSQNAITRRNLTMQQLSASIAQKEQTVSGLNDQLGSEEESLASILRETNELDQSTAILTAFSAGTISDFFADIDQFGQINEEMQNSFTAIQSNKQINQTQEASLQTQLQQQTQLLQVQQLQEQTLQAQEDQKNQLLAQTKGTESGYQSLLSSNQKTAAQIRAALFALTGTQAIPFGTALQYAELAQQKTGIRPAFLLGIISEESDLGENVGTGNWQTDMGPGQTAMFQVIASSLGLDPDTLPVSKKEFYGYGGAMGPAQFIPNTWALYAGYTLAGYNPSKDRIGPLTGDSPPSPWNPKDAFMAAALYLTDDGAAKQTPSAEFTAAMCYLAGCGNVNDPDLQFYGNQVASLAAEFQQEINVINGS